MAQAAIRIVACFTYCLLPTLLPAQSSNDELVNLKELIPDIVIDLKYNTLDNFVSAYSGVPQKLYTTDECFVARATAQRLIIVQDSLRKMGRGLKMWDGYRPRTVQYLMWEYVGAPFVADPNTGSRHNRGAAVDVTIVDLATGEELPMPTTFDFFGPEARHDYNHPDAQKKANREFLLSMMKNVGGFVEYVVEWWHYEYNPAAVYP
ncbi:MAG: M15 family metallopeptidase, partial [Bacteroidota bacterium]